MNHWSLKGKKALITGASKGIGKAINEEFLQLGASTIIVSRSESELEELQRTYSQQDYDCKFFAADLTQPEEVKRLIQFVQDKWQSLDVLVNNAGRNLRKPTLEYQLNDLRQVMQLNMDSVFQLTTGLHSLLKHSGRASVVNISSIASKTVVQTSTAAYHMSKGALDKLTDFLAVEWGKDGIRVNSVHPWYIRTPLGEQVLKDEKVKQRIESVTPLQRVGEPEEVARAVAFLAMEASSYISGAHLRIDGAFSKAGMPPAWF